jgi:hypothetical protein
MIIRLTNAERDTILAALRRWQSFPAAREADAVATNGGKHRPLDNAEIERICKRMTRMKQNAMRRPRVVNQAMALTSTKRLKLLNAPLASQIVLETA